MKMRKPSVEDMLNNKTTRYSLVMAVAKRARQIAAENEKKDEVVDEKPVLEAIEDFKNNKYSILEPDINE
ncbi:DNA-directed RNA polymerase subunit omega [Oscillospiraceae bacterium LCP25S3_E10]|jgi:DNA-directed RNA polymerase subunit omega|nr:DNA-directed RNA polymerase subunit omega [Ruminococcus sp.]MDD6446365.1 DNA-directed RNA polymerase subunit omega [Ruminococcus sp.]MDY2856042.1 DNA-directed RNA polymerase subunit omega [Oscillospiraceae bacterium]